MSGTISTSSLDTATTGDQRPAPAAITFQECRMPDGSPTGRKMWRATDGDNYAAFYPVGRKGRFYVTWGLANGNSGGQQTESREAAELRAREILARGGR